MTTGTSHNDENKTTNAKKTHGAAVYDTACISIFARRQSPISSRTYTRAKKGEQRHKEHQGKQDTARDGHSFLSSARVVRAQRPGVCDELEAIVAAITQKSNLLMSMGYVKKQKARRVCRRHGHHSHRRRLRFWRAKVRRIRAIPHASCSPPSQRAPLNSPDHGTRRRSQLRQLRLTRSTCPLRFPRLHHVYLHHLLLWPLRVGLSVVT